MNRAFNNILTDKTSGSEELLIKLITYLLKKIQNGKSISEEIQLAKRYLGHFATIKFHLDKISLIDKKNDSDSLISYLSGVLNSNESIYKKIYSSIPSRFRKLSRILTISNSMTVLEILKLWSYDNNQIKVIVTESRPECEGKILIKKLLNSDVDAELIPDSNISSNVEKSDLILLGCDVILKNGSIINKTGSRSAAIVAKYFNKPVVVVSSRTKIIRSNKHSINGRDNSEKELFETVEKSLITKIITD